MQRATLPSLAAGEHAFTLDSGETVVVAVVRDSSSNNPNASAVRLTARMVDPATGDTVHVGDSPVVAPTFTATFMNAAIADGLDVATELAGQMEAEAQRVRGIHAALSALAGLAIG